MRLETYTMMWYSTKEEVPDIDEYVFIRDPRYNYLLETRFEASKTGDGAFCYGRDGEIPLDCVSEFARFKCHQPSDQQVPSTP